MTDDHGSDQHPENEVPEQEHHAEASESHVWSDDHPPVDDFADAGNAGEETATVSQEAVESDEGTTSPPRSRSVTPVLAGIGGLLLIGAVVYWQFGHSSSPPPMMPAQTSSPKSPSSMASNANTQVPAAPAAKKTDESDITALYKPPSESGGGVPAETSPTTSMTSDSATHSPAPSMPAAPPAAAPPPPVPTPAPVMPAAAPPPPAPASVVAASPALDARIDELDARMDALQKSAQATAIQLSQLNSAVAASQTMPPVASQASPALENRLNKIEQSLMQIEHKEAAAKPAPSVTMPEESEAAVRSETVTAKPVSHKHTPAKHKHKISKAVKPSHHEMVMAPMPTLPERASSAWVLRAATPTEAWIAADAHTAELRHVQVGDNVTGVGQIRAIHQTPSGWEIEGTGGTIQ